VLYSSEQPAATFLAIYILGFRALDEPRPPGNLSYRKHSALASAWERRLLRINGLDSVCMRSRSSGAI